MIDEKVLKNEKKYKRNERIKEMNKQGSKRRKLTKCGRQVLRRSVALPKAAPGSCH